MGKKLIDLSLPEWVFWEGYTHEGKTLGDRTVIEHVRSATVMEIFDRDHDNVLLKPDVLTFKFINEGIGRERLLVALHYSLTLDKDADREALLVIMKRCAMWYCDYCDWEDSLDL